MTNKRLNWRTLGLPVYIVLALLVVFVVILVLAFVAVDSVPDAGDALSAADMRARVDALLVDANPENGELLVVEYGCAACHREGAANGIAPTLGGVVYRAEHGRSSLPPDLYLYQSIVEPSAYVVEGYPDMMPRNFASRISDQELGDIIAYLLTDEAH